VQENAARPGNISAEIIRSHAPQYVSRVSNIEQTVMELLCSFVPSPPPMASNGD
jgi:hypothetical protein